MKSFFKFFIDNSILVNTATFIIIVVGILSMVLVKKDTFPEVNFDIITITTVYPGASAEDVEKLVTIPIERKLKEVDGIEEVNAYSYENRSNFILQLGSDSLMSDVYDEVKSAIDSVIDLPSETEKPIITKIHSRFRSIIKIAMIGENEEELKTASKELRDRLELIPEVASIELGGARDHEYRVQVDLDKLNQYELTLGEVATYLKDRNINLSAGTIKTKNADIMVRTLAEFTSTESIEEVVIRSNKAGHNIKIKDIAKVSKTFEEESSFQRSDGKPAIYLEVKKRFNGDVIKTSEKLKKSVDDFIKIGKYPQIKISYTDDLSFYVKRRLGVLSQNGVQGMIFVFFCLLLFLNARVSFITSLGAPLAFMISFIVMDSMNLTLNLISMFGLILVLGMLVDDSIIVAEYFYQYVEKGMGKKEAALKAAVETVKPVLATIITTILAFSSLFFIGGIMGKFIWQIPLMVIICLGASLFECFFILPGHLSDFTSPSKEKNKERKWFIKIKKIYHKHLTFYLRYYPIVCVTFFVLFLGTLFLATKMRFELFPKDDAQIISFNLQGAVGTPLQQTDQVLKDVEKIIQNYLEPEEIEQMRSITGQQIEKGGGKQGSHYGSVLTYLTMSTDRDRSAEIIMKEISEEVKKVLPTNYTLNPSIFAGGPPQKNPLEIEFYGNDLDELLEVTKKIRPLIQNVEGVLTTESDFEEGKQQMIIKIDEVESKRLGLTIKQIAYEIRQAFALDSITTIKESDEDIDVRIYLDPIARSTTKTLEKIYILNKEGRRINLSHVATVEKKMGAFYIRRFNGKRIIAITGNINRKILPPIKMDASFSPIIDEVLKDYPHITYQLGGETKDTKDSLLRVLKAAIISLLSIFLVLVAIFKSIGKPFIIMSAIPLGLVGVVLTFLILGKPLSFLALLGVIGLVGVVVNDSIVLVNFILEKRKNEIELFKAVTDASIDRIRPVLLTTFTTVAGLLPIAHDPDGDPFLKPMALAFAYGLLFATFITLVFIPSFYIMYEKVISRLTRFFTFKKSIEDFS